jgi:putative membrane protein
MLKYLLVMSNYGFTDAEVEAVRRAVAAAETTAAGEIVPYVVGESDTYAAAAWRGVAVGALGGPLLAWGAARGLGWWADTAFLAMVVPAALGGAVGLWALHVLPTLRRWLAGSHTIELRTRQRAAQAFLEQEVFRTRERNGILLFLSLFERRVVVLADSGIHARVGEEEWKRLIGRIVAGIRSGDASSALVAAIRECGELLTSHGLRRSPGQPNELGDDLRQGGSQ